MLRKTKIKNQKIQKILAMKEPKIKVKQFALTEQ